MNYQIGADVVDEETYKAFEQTSMHPTYEESNKCLFEKNIDKCDILEIIGSYDSRCQGCPNKEKEKVELITLFK